MITIGRPYLCPEGDRVSLRAKMELGGQTREAYFSVEAEYGPYLTQERSDAFVVGFLSTAMRLGEDIYCEAPITKRLEYQLNHYLIPTLAQNTEIYHAITVHGPTAEEPLPCAGAVGTGWTGGVDCMYTLSHHLQAEEPGFRVTHLLIANNGAMESSHNQELLAYMANKTRSGIAKELGLKVISVDTNLHLLQDETFLAVVAFRMPATVLAVQKLFGVFLHSSSIDFSRFVIDQFSSAYYELLLLSSFETDCTAFYSACGSVPRIQKLKELSEIPMAQRYLHPCIYAHRPNCCQCGKCVRTMGALYALGTLDNFREVFDVDGFYAHKEDYLADILVHKDNLHYREVLQVLSQRGIPISQEAQRRARIRKAASAIALRNQSIIEEIPK